MLPTGIFLLMRMSPLYESAPAAQSLLLGIGCLSMLLCGLLAATRTTKGEAIIAFVAASLGLVCVGMATAGGFVAATYLAAGTFVCGAALLAVEPGPAVSRRSAIERQAGPSQSDRTSRTRQFCGYVLAFIGILL